MDEYFLSLSYISILNLKVKVLDFDQDGGLDPTGMCPALVPSSA